MDTTKITKTNPLGLTMEDLKPYVGVYGEAADVRPNWHAHDRGITNLAIEITGVDKEIKCVEDEGFEWDYPLSDFLMDDPRVSQVGRFVPMDCEDETQIRDYEKVRADIRKVIMVSNILYDPRLLLTHTAVDVFAMREGRVNDTTYVKVSEAQWNRIKAFKEPKPYSKTYRQFVHDPWVTTSGECIVWDRDWVGMTVVFHKDELKHEYSYPMDYWD